MKAPPASALKLEYEFVSDPNPIRASVSGANPNVIDLHIRIKSPNSHSVTVLGLDIKIPVGSSAIHDLSALALPQPDYGQSAIWTMKSTGSVLSITTINGGQADINTLECTLRGIKVNSAAGDVPITVTERYPEGAIKDGDKYSLTKEDADFPITSFYAEPRVIDDQDQSVTLYWKCSDQGEKYVYAVRSDDRIGWQPKNCLGNGDCYTCQDGAVPTPPLPIPPDVLAVDFYLDVIRPSTIGNRTIFKTLKTTVQVAMPSLSPNVKLTAYGRLVRLHWLAVNAARCRISLASGEVLVESAPVDAYRHGYVVPLPARAVSDQLVVTARAPRSQPEPSVGFYPTVSVPQPSVFSIAYSSVIAITPDAQRAFVIGGIHNTMSGTLMVVDLRTMQQASTPYSLMLRGAAGLPDGQRALITCTDGAGFNNLIYVIDLNTLQQAGYVRLRLEPGPIAVSPDGKTAFVMAYYHTVLMVVDLTKPAETDIDVPDYAYGIAITPDGTRVLLSTANNSAVVIVDTQTLRIITTIPVQPNPYRIAITPDSHRALVQSPDAVTVIDLVATRVVSTIPLPQGVQSVTITPDGALALITTSSPPGVMVIDLATLSVAPQMLAAGKQPVPIAITPDGKRILVGDWAAQTLTVW